MEVLLVKFEKLVSSIIDKQIEPIYSYWRMYFKGSELIKHKDLRSEISITLFIGSENNYKWPLFIEIENKKKEINKKDIFLSLSFLGLCHSIIEDTILILLLGSHISGILFFRFIYTVIIILIMKIILEVRFSDMFPVALSGLSYNQQATDVEYLTATVDFAYQIYEIEPIV